MPQPAMSNGSMPTVVTASTERSAPTSWATAASGSTGLRTPGDVSPWTDASNLGRPRRVERLAGSGHDAVHAGAEALGHDRHALPEHAVRTDHHGVARLEQVG